MEVERESKEKKKKKEGLKPSGKWNGRKGRFLRTRL